MPSQPKAEHYPSFEVCEEWQFKLPDGTLDKPFTAPFAWCETEANARIVGVSVSSTLYNVIRVFDSEGIEVCAYKRGKIV